DHAPLAVAVVVLHEDLLAVHLRDGAWIPFGAALPATLDVTAGAKHLQWAHLVLGDPAAIAVVEIDVDLAFRDLADGAGEQPGPTPRRQHAVAFEPIFLADIENVVVEIVVAPRRLC